MTPSPSHTSAPNTAITMEYSQSGHVKLHQRKSMATSCRFWMMKMIERRAANDALRSRRDRDRDCSQLAGLS